MSEPRPSTLRLVRDCERASLAFAAGAVYLIIKGGLRLLDGEGLGLNHLLALVGLPLALLTAVALNRQSPWVAARWPHALLCVLGVVAVVFRPRASLLDGVLALALLTLIVFYAAFARHLGSPGVRARFTALEARAPIDWFGALFSGRAFLALSVLVLALDVKLRPPLTSWPILEGLARFGGAMLAVAVLFLGAHALLRGELPPELRELFEPEPESVDPS